MVTPSAFLGFRGLYKVKRPVRYIVELVYVGIGLFLLSRLVDPQLTLSAFTVPSHILWTGAVLLIALYCLREIWQTRHLSSVVRSHQLLSNSTGDLSQWHLANALTEQYTADDTRHRISYLTIRNTEQSCLYDMVVDEERSTKFGNYLAYQAVHTVFEIKLQRFVPHVIFDNKQAHGRQFRSAFVGSQQLSFEGNVDDIFAVYAPRWYQIDAFAFLSPEVLDAMVRAPIPCDIEIRDNRLLCYAPAIPADQLQAFANQCLNIYAHLNDNLDTYRDNNLTGKARLTATAAFARRLLESPWRHWGSLLSTGILSVGILGAAVVLKDKDIVLNQMSVVVLGSFSITAWQAIKTARHNRREIARFMQIKEYMQASSPLASPLLRQPKDKTASPTNSIDV